MKKLAVVFLFLFVFALPAVAEIRSMDITIFGMD